MAIGITLMIILICTIIGGAVWWFKAYENDKPVLYPIVLIIASILAFIFIPFSFHTVQTGEVAVVKVLGEAKEVKNPGTSFALWITNAYVKYDTKVQNVDITTAAYSSDAQTMDVQMTLQYQIMADKVMDINKQYGSLEALQTRIQAIVVEKTKAVLSSYKAMDIIADRAAMSPAVEESIRSAIGEEYYVTVTSVVLTNIDFSDAFEKAVEDKMIAEQNKLKADYENQTSVAKTEAEAAAKLKTAQAAIDIAKAEAEAKKIAADGEAAANKIISESLTDEVLKQQYYDKWNGQLPSTVAGDDTGIMVGVK